MQDNEQHSRTCQMCDGEGYVPDIRVASITHERTEVKRRCRNCDNGVLRPAPSSIDGREQDPEVAEWVLSWMNED